MLELEEQVNQLINQIKKYGNHGFIGHCSRLEVWIKFPTNDQLIIMAFDRNIHKIIA